MAFSSCRAGADCPAAGRVTPGQRSVWLGGAALSLLLASSGCNGAGEQRTLPSVQVAMDRNVAPIFDDGELTLYEVRVGNQLPILAPKPSERAALDAEVVEPYGRRPWVETDDIGVQLSWTITNLDDEAHTVELLIDPWNEFGKYFPGLQVIDAEEGEFLPNLSGFDYLYVVEGKDKGAGSRRHGTITFDEMDEMARDFGTVMSLIADPPPAPEEGESPIVAYVNHAFAFQNHSDRDPLVRRWVPKVVPALTGFDVGLRTREPAAIAIEVVAEVIDRGSDKLQVEGRDGALLEEPTEIVTVGSAAPAP